MRARSIKPGFFKNADLSEVPFEARILFQGLWCLADRKGRLIDRPKQIKGEIFPYDDVNVSTMLERLQHHAFILRYEKDKNRYIQIINFEKHQYPHIKEAESTIPAPDKHHTSIMQKRLTPDSCVLTPESNNTLAQAPKREIRHFVKPSHVEVQVYAQSIGFNFDAEAWVDHYEANGWRVGKAPMKDWKAAVRTWKRRQKEFAVPQTSMVAPSLGKYVEKRPAPDEIFDPAQDKSHV